MGLEDERDGQTLIDPSGLLEHLRGKIFTRNELDEQEGPNIRKATVKYLSAVPTPDEAPFHVQWVLDVHCDMFCDVWEWAGVPRQRPTNMAAFESPAHCILGDLQDLLNALHSWTGFGWSLIEQAAKLHHGAVRIHPFPNGNGRWSRMLANIWLLRNEAPIVEWPADLTKEKEEKSPIHKEYLEAIRAADQCNFDPLIDLHKKHQLLDDH